MPAPFWRQIMKVLVSAASRHGSTAEIAQAIARQLIESGLEVAIIPPDEMTDLAGYDAVVLGSAVYLSRWLPAAREMVDRLAEQLTTRPVWLFSSGPIGDTPKPDQDHVDVARMVAATGARGHRTFAGRLVHADLRPTERAVIALLRVPDRDDRDWDEITSWSRLIARELLAVTY
jgi:menaquinone-dependent protoporphyrinogen oxidase